MNILKATFKLYLLSAFVNADNTANICTAGIKNLVEILPSETNTHPIPNITVGGYEYSGDASHFVVRPPSNQPYKKALVYIPGTTDRPELSSCVIKSAAETLAPHKVPVLALSYQYLSSGDKFRNGKCALLETTKDQVYCLSEQHEDAIVGGDYGATHFKEDGSAFWGEVLMENSLTCRLGDLIKHLHTLYPNDGWDTMYTMKSGMAMPIWKKLIFSGHSQGAGHVAYLAKKRPIAGAIMISGPQDECIDCDETTKTWIDWPNWKNKGPFTALAHESEGLYWSAIKKNWLRMQKSAGDKVQWKPPSPTRGTKTKNVGFAEGDYSKAACKCPLVTNIMYANRTTCGGKEHCSVAIDDTVPYYALMDGTERFAYDKSVWPSIFEGALTC